MNRIAATEHIRQTGEESTRIPNTHGTCGAAGSIAFPNPAALPAPETSSFLADPLCGLSDAEVRRLKRADLLEILIAQGDEIARLRAENGSLREAAAAAQATATQLTELCDLVCALDSRQKKGISLLRDLCRQAQPYASAVSPAAHASEPGAASAALAPASRDAAAASPAEPRASQQPQSKPLGSGLARKLISAAAHIGS